MARSPLERWRWRCRGSGRFAQSVFQGPNRSREFNKTNGRSTKEIHLHGALTASPDVTSARSDAFELLLCCRGRDVFRRSEHEAQTNGKTKAINTSYGCHTIIAVGINIILRRLEFRGSWRVRCRLSAQSAARFKRREERLLSGIVVAPRQI